MKTSTVIVLVLAFVVLSGGIELGGRASSPDPNYAPPDPTPPQQSGGNETFNTILGIIRQGGEIAAKSLDMAADRSKPAS